MNFLIFSDTHFSDNPRDGYRFGLFKWLAEQQQKYKPEVTLLLGDCTERKDFHSSELVNKIVDGLKLLKPPIYICRGNHDGNDPTTPFFKFLNSINGITFCVEPTYIKEHNIYMLPHQRNQVAFEAAFKQAPEGCYLMMHNTLSNAISETGSRLTGLAVPSKHKAFKGLYAGDVHVPQRCGEVTYIGSPFHVRFGDKFIPRVLLLQNGKEIDLHFPAPKKLSLKIRDLSEFPKLSKGDQVKVTLELTRSEAVEWANHKKSILDHCKQYGIEVYGTEVEIAEGVKQKREVEVSNTKSNLDYFQAFCITEQVPANIKTIGNKILGGNSE